MELWQKILNVSEDRNFGFCQKDGIIKFLIPEQLIPPEGYEFFYLKRYNEILKKYSKSKHKDLLYNSSINNNNIEDINLDIISSCLSLLEDYLSNGYFHLFEKFYNKDNKKINWNKTLQEDNIIISKRNNIIYNGFISKGKITNPYHQYSLLYKEGLRRSKKLFLGEDNEEIDSFAKETNEQRYHLYKYREEHFKDRELFIANNLINIFLNEKWNSSEEKSFEFKYHLKFENIWQEMISSITNKYHFTTKIKCGKYVKNNGNGLGLIHDHFLRHNNKYYLLDSKFYKSYNGGEFPATDDISKQFLYRYIISIQENININNINNFFIFPKNNPHNTSPEIFDIHKVDGMDEFTIYCIAVDINIVIDLYLKGGNYNDLLNKLEEIYDNPSLIFNSLFNNHKNENEEFIEYRGFKLTDIKDYNIFDNYKNIYNNSTLQTELEKVGIIKKEKSKEDSLIYTQEYLWDINSVNNFLIPNRKKKTVERLTLDNNKGFKTSKKHYNK